MIGASQNARRCHWQLAASAVLVGRHGWTSRSWHPTRQMKIDKEKIMDPKCHRRDVLKLGGPLEIVEA